MGNIIVGCVADDFTGASDVASFFVKAGIKTYLFSGVPKDTIDFSSHNIAVVIALKTRTQDKSGAVNHSMDAFEWLIENGAEKLFFKYCSTFDSTKEGNIGPIIDSVLEKFNIKYTILCPALPVNGRIVKDGHLLVDGVPLHETHMKDHPLTPMWDSDISKLMKPQGKYDSLKIDYKMLKKSKEKILEIINKFGKDREHFYVIPDYINDEDGKKIIEVFGDIPLLTGGSGLIYDLGIKYRDFTKKTKGIPNSKVKGKAMVLAGSCSKVTLEQIDDYIKKGYKTYKLDPIGLYNGNQTKESIWKNIELGDFNNILVYSSDTPQAVREAQKYGVSNVSNLLEETIAYIAKKAINSGYKRLIVAGGETSGAVTKSLGYTDYIVGESIAPGVPVMVPIADNSVRLVLKSGNFGQRDFFHRAIKYTEEN